MDNDSPLTDRIRGWFERSPRAQQVYRRLSADLDTVVEHVEAATSGLRERVAPIIDPQREPAPEPAPEPPLAESGQTALGTEETTAEAGPGATGPDVTGPDVTGRSDPGTRHPSP